MADPNASESGPEAETAVGREAAQKQVLETPRQPQKAARGKRTGVRDSNDR